MKVAVNKCYGGFSPSNVLYEALIAKGWKVTKYNDDYEVEDKEALIIDSGEDDKLGISRYHFADGSSTKLRSHPDLVEAIEMLGEAANTMVSKLKVVEIPDDVNWKIEEYDGFEHIAEVHRTW